MELAFNVIRCQGINIVVVWYYIYHRKVFVNTIGHTKLNLPVYLPRTEHNGSENWETDEIFVDYKCCFNYAQILVIFNKVTLAQWSGFIWRINITWYCVAKCT